jgi:hypothetical protein
MRHPEGMRITLVEEAMLERTGILRGAVGSTDAGPANLSAEALQLFMAIAAAGEGGLAQSRVPRELKKDMAAHLLPLELQELVAWERDKRGRLAYLVLTWKGQETLDAARPRPAAKVSLAARRKAALRNSDSFH